MTKTQNVSLIADAVKSRRSYRVLNINKGVNVSCLMTQHGTLDFTDPKLGKLVHIIEHFLGNRKSINVVKFS